MRGESGIGGRLRSGLEGEDWEGGGMSIMGTIGGGGR